MLSRGGYELLEKKLMDEKIKKRQQDAMNSEDSSSVMRPSSPIPRQLKWKMARTKKYGSMTSVAAQEIVEKIDSLEEQATQGAFVPQGQYDILNTAIGKKDHPGRVRGEVTGVTIRQYFGSTSRASSGSSASISPQQLAALVKHIKEECKRELKEEIKLELSQMGSPMSNQVQPDIDNALAKVSTKGSCAENEANPSAGQNGEAVSPCMGLYVQSKGSTRLVAMGKICDGKSTIHNVEYADDVVRVTVSTVIDGEADVPFPNAEIKKVRDTVNTFVAWPKNLVKPLSHQDPQECPNNEIQTVSSPTSSGSEIDELDDLVKLVPDVYYKPVAVRWKGSTFGHPNVDSTLFITFSDVNEILAGDRCLNISVVQLWIMYMAEWTSSLVKSSVYAFFEPQSILNAKDRRAETQEYIDQWMQDSQKELYLGAYLNQAHWQLFILCPKDHTVVWLCSLRKKPDVHIKTVINNAMKKLKTTTGDKPNPPPPTWIELKSHVQPGGYECGYYVMYWMWNIVIGDLKNDWSKWFNDGTSLAVEQITVIRKKWAAFFLEVKCAMEDSSFNNLLHLNEP